MGPAALSASEARWQSLVENLPGVVAVVDSDGVLVGIVSADDVMKHLSRTIQNLAGLFELESEKEAHVRS